MGNFSMAFKLFYTDYSKDKHLRSDEAKPATIDNIVDCMNSLLLEADNFVGIIDSNDVMLQFMVEDDGTICIDIPIHERKGSFTKISDLSESIKIVSALQKDIILEQINGLEFKSWGR